MEPTGTKRKLAAILMADVAGYTRLVAGLREAGMNIPPEAPKEE